jgi:hypothetical protein
LNSDGRISAANQNAGEFISGVFDSINLPTQGNRIKFALGLQKFKVVL